MAAPCFSCSRERSGNRTEPRKGLAAVRHVPVLETIHEIAISTIILVAFTPSPAVIFYVEPPFETQEAKMVIVKGSEEEREKNTQTRLGEDIAARKAELAEAERREAEWQRSATARSLGISPEGVPLLECPRCGSNDIYAPYPVDKEEELGWVTLRCRDCWKEGVRVQMRTTLRPPQKDGRKVHLVYRDGAGARYVEV